MADAHAKPQHDYHLVEPSPWPALGSVSAFVAAVGGITWMHHMFPAAPYIFGVGVIGILYTMLGWWTDVAREATHEGYHTQVVQISHRYGMILFIASEVMFFVAWFWAYFNSALFPADMHQVTREQLFGGVWPPHGIETFDLACEALMDHAERLMRQAIAKLPDGVYRAETAIDGYLDSPDANKKELPIVVTITKKDDSLTAADVLQHCRTHLTGYKMPREVEFRKDLPKTNVGKILRRELRDEARKAAA